MFQLLDGEEVHYDLRRGALQRLSQDLFLLKTIILTNKRLILVNKRLGSYLKKFIFLKDVQGLESQSSFNIPFMLMAIGAGVLSLLCFSQIGEGAGAAVGLGVFFLVVMTGFAINVRRNAILISTMTEDIEFLLEKNLQTERLNEFIDVAQSVVASQKNL